MPHLQLAITYHGLGHLAQTAPIINHLRHTMPELRLTVQCQAPRSILESWLEGEFALVENPGDPGMANVDAMGVDAAQSARLYCDLYNNRESLLARHQLLLQQQRPDLLVSNVGFLPLLAARQSCIPAVALGSINWADIYSSYCAGLAQQTEISAYLYDAYRCADHWIELTPGMPGKSFAPTTVVDPVARTGRDQRLHLRQTLGLPPDQKLVLLTMGGIDTPIDLSCWPSIPGISWLASGQNTGQKGVFASDTIPLPYIDILCSCDAIITKPGYGSFAEAGCNGIALLYVERGDWPEEPYLIPWLQQAGHCARISRKQLASGDFIDNLQELWQQPKKTPIKAEGISQAAQTLKKLLAE